MAANLKALDNRRATFSNWPKPNVDYDELARAGFYYEGVDDRTICAYCKGCVKNWSERDEPILEHARLFPCCPFILNPPLYALKGQDECGHTKPDNSSYDQRLNTFNKGWTSSVKPKHLAAAGFYFIGIGDCVKCFRCGLGLNHWLRTDNAWQEHSRWEPSCQFVSKIKGPSFAAKNKDEQSDLLLEKYHQISMVFKEPLILPSYIRYSLPVIMGGEEVACYVSRGVPRILISKILKKFMLDNDRGFESKHEVGKVLSSTLSFQPDFATVSSP
jgi:hypothetical protein